jgi:hypothetical protein
VDFLSGNSPLHSTSPKEDTIKTRRTLSLNETTPPFRNSFSVGQIPHSSRWRNSRRSFARPSLGRQGPRRITEPKLVKIIAMRVSAPALPVSSRCTVQTNAGPLPTSNPWVLPAGHKCHRHPPMNRALARALHPLRLAPASKARIHIHMVGQLPCPPPSSHPPIR